MATDYEPLGPQWTVPTTKEQRDADRVALRESSARDADRDRQLREFDAWSAEYDQRESAKDARDRRNTAWTVEKYANRERQRRHEHLLRATGAKDGVVEAKQKALALKAHERANDWDEVARELRSVAVKHEPPPYGPSRPNSYFADLMYAMQPTASEARTNANRRLEAHCLRVGLDAVGGRSREARALRDLTRRDAAYQLQSEEEYRTAMSTAPGSAGALVPPAYLTDKYALWRSYVPAVADACTNAGLPDYGMAVNVPAATAADAVTAQSENSAVTETDMTATYRTVALVTYAGTTLISQQLFDRAGPTGIDEVIYAQLRQTLDAQVDNAVIAAMIAGATTNLTRATWTDMSSFWSDVAQAAASLETAPGTVLPATHAFVPPLNFRWLASQVDNNKRPIWTPDAAQPDPNAGYTGHSVAGTAVYTDGSIPQTSGHATLLVANPASTLVFRGEPVVQVIPEQYAADLSCVVRLYQYAAVVVRYPNAAATISGGAYPASPVFA